MKENFAVIVKFLTLIDTNCGKRNLVEFSETEDFFVHFLSLQCYEGNIHYNEDNSYPVSLNFLFVDLLISSASVNEGSSN